MDDGIVKSKGRGRIWLTGMAVQVALAGMESEPFEEEPKRTIVVEAPPEDVSPYIADPRPRKKRRINRKQRLRGF